VWCAHQSGRSSVYVCICTSPFFGGCNKHVRMAGRCFTHACACCHCASVLRHQLLHEVRVSESDTHMHACAYSALLLIK